MSRCFPYPPPGYTLSRSSEDALIESIKLQKENKQAKEQRKEKRKEKKERRKEKAERRKERKEKTNLNSDKYDISKEHGKNFWANIDHLEKSGLTEEHEQPICLHIPSTSSESTENSTKRKRDFSPIDGKRGHGNIIRIRVASKKQNLSNSSIDEHLCSTSGRIDIPTQNKDEIGHKSKQEAIYIPTKGTRKFDEGLTAGTGTEKEPICLISKNDTGVPGITGGTSPVLDAVRSSIQKLGLKYNKLIETWLPPQLEDICLDTDDIDWLFCGKNQGIRAEKRLKSECDSVPCSSSSTLWQPHARFLPEVDVHALPFTVPFA